MSALDHPAVAVRAERLMALQALLAGPAAPPAPGEAAGDVALKRGGAGVEPFDARPYAAGDDLRHLDPHLSRRRGAPHLRRRHEERERALLLIADFRPSMLWGSRGRLRSVAAAEALALAGWRAAAAGARIGALTLTASGLRASAPRAGARGIGAASGLMESAHAEALTRPAAADPPLAAALEEAARLLARGGEALIATGFDAPGERAEAALTRLSARAPTRVLLIRDALERAPPEIALPWRAPGGAARLGRLGAREDPRPARLRGCGARIAILDADAAPGAAPRDDG